MHKTLRKDVDENSSSIKNLKVDKKALREDTDKLKATQTSNSTRLNAVSLKVDAIHENILEKMGELIDDRVDKKFKELKEAEKIPEPVLNEDQLMEKYEKKIQEKVDNMVDDQKLKETMDNNIKARVEGLSLDHPFLPAPDMDVDVPVGSTYKPQVSKVFSSAVNNVLSEREQIEKRKLQIVITNLPENDNPDTDKNDAEEIFTYMKCKVKIVDILRVGKPKRERPRPLRITLENMQDKRTLLSKATTLRNIPSGSKFEKVYVKPNLTILHQEQAKNLHIQLQEVRLKNPQKTYKITRGKIVEVPQSD